MNEIIEQTQREAIVNRPYNFAGSIKKVKKERFNVTSSKIEYSESAVVPSLMKIFMEILDNPIDIHIKYDKCNQINVNIDSKSVKILDNGIGINTSKANDNESYLYKAFCKYNTSSNYKDEKGNGQKGVNGLGASLTCTLSTYFKVISEDKNSRLQLEAFENNLTHKEKTLKKTGKTGVEVYFEPDFNIFEVNEIDETHINRMYEYTLLQSLTYPNIKFKFNGKLVKINPKQFVKLLGDSAVIEEKEDYFIAVLPNDTGEFKQLSYINGLEISEGGSHIDYVLDILVKNLRAKISKKYKTIKPGDIKAKLTFVIIGKNMKNIDWEGQVKNKIASTNKNLKEYFKDLDIDKFSEKVYKNKDILNGIIEYFKIQEEFKKRKELEKLDKKQTKKPKDDKFLAPVGEWDSILLCEGDCLDENTLLLDCNFKPKKIKYFREGDGIISGDGSIQFIKSIRQSLRKAVSIKTKSSVYISSEKHKFYVYNTKDKEFQYKEAKDIVQNKEIYKMVKSRLNSSTKGSLVIKNKDFILETEYNNITYTNNDYFLVFRKDKVIRVHGTKIKENDYILFS